MHFNPRSPCGERRDERPSNSPGYIFQSTLPVRGATLANAGLRSPIQISIHAPRAGSDFRPLPLTVAHSAFQSTLPVRGATGWRPPSPYPVLQFQSTLPVRGATRYLIPPKKRSTISIHAPRAGSDLGAWKLESEFSISIHAPRAGSDMMWST